MNEKNSRPSSLSDHNISVRQINRVNESQLKQLYQDAGWWQPAWEGEPGWMNRMVSGSFCCFAAFSNTCMIGFGRAVSDSASDAYIQDVVVLKKFAGLGIGSKIVSELINFLRERGIHWIALIAEPGTMTFYQKIGFKKMSGHIPMKLEEK